MPFAQLVIGPPGAGKSTYCNGMHQFLSAIGRKCSIVNLDPANETMSYSPALDVSELVSLNEIMNDDKLGPNGAVLYALEELEQNFEWLEEGLKALGESYVLFDCPGQVELFTHHSSLRNIFFRIQKMGYRTVAVNLVDSYCLTLPSLYISSLLLSLRSMLQLELPHVNVLTKIDNLINYPRLPFDLEYYCEAQNLQHLLPQLAAESPIFTEGSKFDNLNRIIVELVEDFGLVGFLTLVVEDKVSMTHLLHSIDRAGGYAFGSAEGAGDTIWQVSVRQGVGTLEAGDVQERWIDKRKEYDEMERNRWKEDAKERANPMGAMNDMQQQRDGDDDDDGDMPLPMPMVSGIKVIRK